MRKLAFALPAACERMIGFTIPTAGVFYVCDHDEVWRVQIEPPDVSVTDDNPYAFVERRTDFLGLVFEGLVAHPPVLSAGGNSIACSVSAERDVALVNYRTSHRSGDIEFRLLSRDWFAASLSEDGRYLVMAEPYELAVYDAS